MQSISKDFKNLQENFSVPMIKKLWNENVKNALDEYMSIPNVSPAFDKNWKENGHIDKVIFLFEKFAQLNAPKTATIKVQEIKDKTPLLFIDIPARNCESKDTVLIYGHSDKQPPIQNWRDGFEPFKANYEGERLYGRGGADDGYAIFTAILATSFIEEQEVSHSRILIIIEASEESGSPDLLDHLKELDKTLSQPIEDVSLVVCLDSGAIDYEHLWITQSLRGLLQVNLEIKVLNQATHSGGAGGIAPSSFHILRELLDRIANPGSGEIILPELHCEIPEHVFQGTQATGEIMGDVQAHGIDFANGVQPIYSEVKDQLIANTYKPVLEIIGIDGLPEIENAGNVLRDKIEVALSFRLPPDVDPQVAASAVLAELKRDVPYSAQVSVKVDSQAKGWSASFTADWLEKALDELSKIYFGKSYRTMGEGGTIPFMAMLGEKFPNAQFMVTGLLGPKSNAHGPNEFLDLPTAYKLTGVLAGVLLRQGLIKAK